MLFHTQCLREVLLLCVIVFPSAYIFFLKPVINVKGNPLLSENAATVIIYGLLTALGIVMGALGNMTVAAAGMGAAAVALTYAVAVAAGFFNVAAEYTEAALPIIVRTKKPPALRPASIYRGSFSFLNCISIIAAAFLEEMVFRQMMIGGIFSSLSIGLLPSVILSGFFYSMNHVYFGRFAVIQKFSSGIVFALIYVLGGGSIILPAISHVMQNLFLYFFALSKTEKKGGAI